MTYFIKVINCVNIKNKTSISIQNNRISIIVFTNKLGVTNDGAVKVIFFLNKIRTFYPKIFIT